MPWLGRWGSCDPVYTKDDKNLYRYCKSNPIARSDVKGTQSQSKPWLTKELTPQHFTNEASVEAWIENIYEYYGWAYQRQVRITVDKGGQPLNGRVDYAAQPPTGKFINSNEVKKANPYDPNSGSTFTKAQGEGGKGGYIESGQNGDAYAFRDGAGNLKNVPPGHKSPVVQSVTHPENLSEFESFVRQNTPGVDSPAKAVPPKHRTKALVDALKRALTLQKPTSVAPKVTPTTGAGVKAPVTTVLSIAPIVITPFWDSARRENDEDVKSILRSGPNFATKDDIESAEDLGWHIKTSPDGHKNWS